MRLASSQYIPYTSCSSALSSLYGYSFGWETCRQKATSLAAIYSAAILYLCHLPSNRHLFLLSRSNDQGIVYPYLHAHAFAHYPPTMLLSHITRGGDLLTFFVSVQSAGEGI